MVTPADKQAAARLAYAAPDERIRAEVSDHARRLYEAAKRDGQGPMPATSLVPSWPDPYTVEIARKVAQSGREDARRALAELGPRFEGSPEYEALHLAWRRFELLAVDLGRPGESTPRVPLATAHGGLTPVVKAKAGGYLVEVGEGVAMTREEALRLYADLGKAIANPVDP